MAGFFFTTSAFSMVGIPAFAGFSSKFLITIAAMKSPSKAVFYAVVIALVVSTILNALYFIRTVIRIYTRPENDIETIVPVREKVDYLLPAAILTGLNLFMGIVPMVTADLIRRGLLMLM